MTPAEFRALALDLPEALESAHMDHPDFRVRGKVFASLAPDASWAMVKLTPEQQREALVAHPGMLTPAKGAWGARGATLLVLAQARVPLARKLLALAWRNVAPKRLADEHGLA